MKIGRYQVVEEIGRGRHGVVYSVVCPAFSGRDLALKQLFGEPGEAQDRHKRFLAEIQALKQIDHPNVAKVLDHGVAGGLPFYVTELARGGDLRQYLDQRRSAGRGLDFHGHAELCEILAQVCEGLAAAHDADLVHRDIKPSNILLMDDGRAVVSDLGVARRLVAIDDVTLTATQAFVGTPAYAAPEQLRRPLEVDGRADLYSVGVILYEAIAGSRPFDGPGLLPLVRSLEEIPDRLSTRCRRVDAGLEDVVARLIARSPENRMASARMAAGALRGDQLREGARGKRRVKSPGWATAMVLGVVILGWLGGAGFRARRLATAVASFEHWAGLAADWRQDMAARNFQAAFPYFSGSP